MIPYWRYVRYTDDGCALYQCLSCYRDWEGRDAPGWTSLEGEYQSCWNYCPVCGVRWEGCKRERADDYGPRRTRIKQAEDARREQFWRTRYDDLPCNQADYWWVVEERSTCLMFNEPHTEPWSARYKAKGGIVPVKEVLEHARSLRETNQLHHRDPQDFIDETRVVKVRDLKAAYPYNQNSIYEIYKRSNHV